MRWTQFFIAVVLLISSGMKGHVVLARLSDASEGAAAGVDSSLLRDVTAATVELLLGVWLIVGVWARTAWRATLAVFSVFLAVALYKAMSGARSCGCFGPVQVHPWYTVTFDSIILGAVLFARGGWPGGERAGHGFVVAAILAVGCFASGAALASYAGYKGDIRGGGISMPSPAEWGGKPFPLTAEIDVGRELARGDWLILLYHHDCPACVEAIGWYERLAEMTAHQVALIQMSPFAPEGGDPAASPRCLRGRLNDRQKYFFETPLLVEVSDGKVVATASGKHVKPPAQIASAGPGAS